MLRTSDLEYDLPSDLIATAPSDQRDEARLMVVRRSEDTVDHRRIRELPEILESGDALIMNDTKVVPARLIGRREDTGGRVEGLWLAALPDGAWRLMLRANRRLKPGLRLRFESEDRIASLTLVTREVIEGTWICDVSSSGDPYETLDRMGRTPLPPYILRARRERHEESHTDREDRLWYQTVFAKRAGAVAAPTAGLHFTPELFRRLDAAGLRRGDVTLHVGPGTFKPVETETVETHPMHAEWFKAPAATLRLIDATHEAARQVIAVGTTCIRVLESLPSPLPAETAEGSTNLLITPGFQFRHVDGVLTNFHLPRSTLLALVAAMLGLERTLEIYRLAVDERYRFYSYGDAMLIVP